MLPRWPANPILTKPALSWNILFWTRCHNDTITQWQNDTMTRRHNDTMTLWHNDNMTIWPASLILTKLVLSWNIFVSTRRHNDNDTKKQLHNDKMSSNPQRNWNLLIFNVWYSPLETVLIAERSNLHLYFHKKTQGLHKSHPSNYICIYICVCISIYLWTPLSCLF